MGHGRGIRLRRNEGATTLPILNCFAIKGVGVTAGGGWQGVAVASDGSDQKVGMARIED